MSPAPFHAKEEQYDGVTYDPMPLKIHKDSNFIQCLPPPPSAASSTTPIPDNIKINKSQDQPPPRPLIIYTHSPKVIHTQPRDFMALVQKLTGYTRPPPEENQQTTQDPRHQQGQGNNIDDNESTSVVTEEHGSSVSDISQVNSCFGDGGVGVTPPAYRGVGFDPYFNHAPVFPTNRTDFMCPSSHQLPFYNPDSLFMNRNSLSSSSSSLRVLKDYRDI